MTLGNRRISTITLMYNIGKDIVLIHSSSKSGGKYICPNKKEIKISTEGLQSTVELHSFV